MNEAMPGDLLQTKLFVPSLRPLLIPRPHLITKLNEGLNGKLTLASAPAGFGKTTLISTWLKQLSASHKIAWLSLDESDNDSARFLAYFMGALQAVAPTMGQSLASAAALPPVAAMQLLLHELTAVTHPFILVLDDYHLITTADIHQAMMALLAYMPPPMHLVIISRADPPFSLSKLRLRRQLTEIRARDLRFRPNEATEFLNQTMGLALSPAEVSLLEKRTEGWIGGLQLAAHSLQLEADKTAFLTAFAGDDRYIADYLLEEVLSSQPEAIQTFLLQSSILKRLNNSLCNVVLERQDSQAILQFLEQANLFIVPLDNRRQWYRYHHLFADLLRDRLEASDEKTRQLHQRASQWYADNELMTEAIEHTLAAADYERAIELILQSAEEIFMSSRLLTLLPWWQKLPPAVRTQNLSLCMMMAWAWLATGHQPESEQCLQLIEQALGTSTQALLTDIDGLEPIVRNGLIEVAAIRLSQPTTEPWDTPAMLTLCQHVLPFLVPEESVFLFSPPFVLRPVVLFNMGLSYQRLGQLDEAAQALAESMEQSQALGNVHIVASSCAHLAQVQMVRGQLHQATETCQRGLERLTALAGKSSPLSGLLHVRLGELFYEWCDLATAVHHFQEGITLAQLWQHRETLLPGYLGLARAALAAGQPHTMQTALKDFAELIAAEPIAADSPAMANQIWLQAQQGQAKPARHWVNSVTDTATLSEETAIIWLRICLRQGKQAEALPILHRRLAEAEVGERWRSVVVLLVLLAVAYEAMGDEETAVNTLTRALTMAEPEGYVRSFIDGGQAVARLLRQGAANGRYATYAQKLLTAFGTATPANKPLEKSAAPSDVLIEPLSDRELEVLHLIAEGLTNKAIAARLHLSLGTVKVHAHHIYGKLDVNGRTQAVAKARSLHILS